MKELRTFEAFPSTNKCVVCGTNENGDTVLVQVDGTKDGNIAEAVPVHLACAVATNYNKNVGILYVRSYMEVANV